MSSTTIRKTQRQQGFTLTEVMIALAIIALLSVVAYPSFQDTVRKARRTDAQAALTLAGNKLERFFSTNHTYTTDESMLGFTVDDDGTAFSAAHHYRITVTAGASGIGSSYIVTATAATGGSQAEDIGCTTLTMDSVGRRTPNPSTSTCW